MKSLIAYIVVVSVSIGILKAQESSPDISKVLGNLFGRLENNYNDSSRVQINDSITKIIDSYVKSDSIFKHKFTNLRHLGQITSPDLTIKIITWNLVLGSSPGKYFCYFIRKGDKDKANKVYRLTTAYREDSPCTDTTYNESDWYGALYYDLKPYRLKDRLYWILLGIDYGNPMVSRKVLDVLSFNADGSITFGKKWFESGDKLRYRIVFEYSATGMMSLRFKAGKSIVFDHLVPFNKAQKGDRQFYGPDYSYDSYSFKDGVWKFSENVDVRNVK